MKGLLIALFVALVHSEPIVTLFPDGAPGEVEGWPGPEVAIVGSDGTTRLYNVPARRALSSFPTSPWPGQASRLR